MTKYNFPGGYDLISSIPRALKQVKDPIGTMEESMALHNGTYTVHLGYRRYIVTQDPGFIEYVLKTNHKNYQKSHFQSEKLAKFIGKGLLTSNGEFWLKQRRLIQPGFHHERIAALYTIIEKTANDFLAHFPEGYRDVYPQMNALAFELVINTLFNIEISREIRAELNMFIREAQAFVIKDIRQFYKSWWFKLSGEERANLDRSQRARNIVRAIIRERQQSGAKFNDLLDMLLEARYEDNGLPMEEEQVIDEILVLIIAGHETTANALSWTLYLLAKNTALQSELRNATGGLSLKGIVANEMLNNIIRESMRLYPPAWISDRVAMADDAYGDFVYPKDTVIVLFYYGLHRSPVHWDKPTQFWPDRFSKEKFSKDQAKAYHPFGGGPRLCIGNNFAMAEMTIFLQAIINQFEVTPADHEPSVVPLVTLKPDKITLNVTRRKSI